MFAVTGDPRCPQAVFVALVLAGELFIVFRLFVCACVRLCVYACRLFYFFPFESSSRVD